MTDRRRKVVWGCRIGLGLIALTLGADRAAAQGEIRRAPLKTTNGAEYHAGATCPPPTETGTIAGSIYACENGDFYTFDGASWIFIGTAGLPVTTGAHKLLYDSGVSQGWSARPTIGDLTWPASDGMAGQLMVTDGNGALGFTDVVDLSGTSDTQVLFNNGAAIGGEAALTFTSATGRLTTSASRDAAEVYPFRAYSRQTNSAPAEFGQVWGGSFNAGHDGADTRTVAGVTSVATNLSGAVTYTVAAGDFFGEVDAGTVAQAAGVRGFVETYGGTTTEAIGVLAHALNDGGTVTTAYGVKVDDVTGATTNYAIKTGTGLVAFGDALTVTGAPVTGATNASPIALTGGSSVDGQASTLTFTAGTASGSGGGGGFNFYAGNGSAGGGFNFVGGNGAGQVGSALSLGGGGDGASVDLNSGIGLAGATDAGDIHLTAGNSVDGAAGSITLTAGTASGMGADGTITLVGTTKIPPLACPMGQTAPLSVDDTGAIVKGSCS